MSQSLTDLSFSSFQTQKVSDTVQASFNEAAQYFTTPPQMSQFYDKYARFDYKLSRCETWFETVDHSVNFLREISKNLLLDYDYDPIRDFILNMRLMSSIRKLVISEDAAHYSNIALLYRSQVTVDAFIEASLTPMNEWGMASSIKNQYASLFAETIKQKKLLLPKFLVTDRTEYATSIYDFQYPNSNRYWDNNKDSETFTPKTSLGNGKKFYFIPAITRISKKESDLVVKSPHLLDVSDTGQTIFPMGCRIPTRLGTTLIEDFKMATKL